MSSTIITILQLKLALDRKSHESKSPEQARLMQAVAHNPEFAKKVDIPQKVGQEFVDADKTAHESNRGYSMDEKLQRLKARRQGTAEFQDIFIPVFEEQFNNPIPEQAERPLPVRFELNGLPISIENQAGTVRKGTDKEGHDWAIQLKAHYGEIRGSVGADGDYVDCFINPDYMPDEQSLDDPVFIVNQHDTYTGEFDEVKVMIGWDDIESAKAAYAENYEDGFPEQEIIETNYSDLTNWLNSQESTEEFEE